MFIRIILYLLFTTIIQCQNSSVNVGTCSCDLTKGVCNTSCCCDTDCSANDIKTFNCGSTSTIQSTCFKDIPIYKSNSPHVVQKKGDRVCVDHEQNSAHDEKMVNQQIDASVSSRSINIDNSVSSPVGTATNLSVYEAGTSVFRYISSASTAAYYTLPVQLFNNAGCFGSQPITYLNDFKSTCNQPLTSQTCTGVLNPANYLTSPFCLITLPSTLAGSSPSHVCCSATASSASWAASTCSNVLQNLYLTIYYLNPNGITGCSVNASIASSISASSVTQTFSVQFLQNGSSLSSTVRSGNPGYIPGDPIIAGNLNGNSITTLSGLTILQASASGGCSGTNADVISFGQNVQSTCLYTPTTPRTCPDLSAASSVFMSYTFNNLYVAGKGSSDPTNISDSWLLVTFCTSQIGSTNGPVCQINSLPTSIIGQCYTRLDVQIAFANFGSVTNPQPIIGAVIYHFQSVAHTTTTATAFLMTQTITFQDVSNPPVAEGDQIPRPNVRLPGDFFYPFTLNRAANPIVFSSVFYLLIFFLFFLI